MLHDTRKLDEVLAELEANSITTWVFGGWAEELHGLCVSRLHNDVDLLFPAKDFDRLDALILCGTFDHIELKRSAHKRAVVLTGVMTEIFLVRQDERGAYTSFWGRTRHDWPVDVLDHRGGRRVASAAALQGYRATHRWLHASRTCEAPQ